MNKLVEAAYNTFAGNNWPPYTDYLNDVVINNI